MPHNTDDSNKTSNSSAPLSGGIFSTPDLTVSSENVPANLVSTDEQANSVQPVVFNDSNAQGAPSANAAGDASANDGQMNISHEDPAQNAPVAPVQNAEEIIRAPGRSNRTNSSATGDLVLPKAPKKPSKAPLIVLAVVVVALVAGGITYLLLQNHRGPSSSEGAGVAKSVGDIQKEFNRQATYMLFGESKDVLEGEYDPDRIYELDRQVAERGENGETYWKTTLDSLKTVISDYEKREDHDENLLSLLRGQQTGLEFLEKYSRIVEPTENELLAKFVESGADETKSYLHGLYAELQGMDYQLAKDYVEDKLKQYETMVDVFSAYSNGECITKSEEDGNNIIIDAVCVNEKLDSDNLEANAITISETEDQALNRINTRIQSLENNCWLLSQRFTEKPAEDESTAEGSENE